jgi:predicted RNase H-like HicB family nuclease
VGDKVVVKNRQARHRTFTIDVAHTDEGAWTATSEAVPGLDIEGETFEEAVAEAEAWAPDLLRANGIVTADESVHLAFSRVDQSLSLDK